MIRINISRPEDYYSQLNNALVPHSSCNTTCMIEMLVVAGIPFDSRPGMQPEDYLTQIMDSKEMNEKLKNEYPWAHKKGYRPAEVHDLLSWAVNNKLVGHSVTEFSTDVSVKEIAFEIAVKKNPVVVSTSLTDTGHMVVVVGFETNQKHLEKASHPNEINEWDIQTIIVDDPYGNYFSEYKDHHGNDVAFTYADFIRLTKEEGEGKKWAHRII